MNRVLKRLVDDAAWDATVGAGNASEEVEFAALERRLRRVPSDKERKAFSEAWKRHLQAMAQP